MIKGDAKITLYAPIDRFNPLTAGVAYMRVFIFYYHIKYHLLNMFKIKCESISNIW